jgi:phage tail sheath protein FI
MPMPLTYPGVYIEEVPSGVRAIAGVATSIAAFVGWAPRGDTLNATLVQSWQDFERKFGGLDPRSLFGYSVYHFFANGGQQAHIVRLVDGAGTAECTIGTELKFAARNPGNWAKAYGVTVKARDDDATRFRVAIVRLASGGAQETVVESFDNLSMSADDPRLVTKVIEAESGLVTAEILGGATTPPANTVAASPLDGAGDLDGTVLAPGDGAFETKLLETAKGVNLLDQVDLFNLLCVPEQTLPAVIATLQEFCWKHRAFLIADCAQGATFDALQNGPDGAIAGANAINSAVYFPWVKAPDPLKENRLSEFPPCGFVAGLYAKTDATRGVWKAPAGIDASLSGAVGLKTVLTDLQNGTLNVKAINCLRSSRTYGSVVWGARTLRGNNEVGSEWKYVPVRRIALFIEESLYRGTQWVVFEPNDEPLWAQIRLNVGTFMQDLFRQGAFQGRSPREAYFVKCDAQTTTESDRNLGVVNILVGFAPLKPAEFVVIKIQQIAGQAQA